MTYCLINEMMLHCLWVHIYIKLKNYVLRCIVIYIKKVLCYNCETQCVVTSQIPPTLMWHVVQIVVDNLFYGCTNMCVKLILQALVIMQGIEHDNCNHLEIL